MIDNLMGWLVFPGMAFQSLLAFATAWIESALDVTFGSRRPMTPYRFVLHWAKGFAKRPVLVRMEVTLIYHIFIVITSVWLGLSIFSHQGIRFDIPVAAFVLAWGATNRQPFSISRWFRLGICVLGFSIPGVYPGATFRLFDVMQFQDTYGPLIRTPAGALAAISTWIVMAFPISRMRGSTEPYPGPISVLASFLSRSGFLWLWTVCFVGGSWHGLSGLRIILAWGALVLSLALVRLLPPMRERTNRGLICWTGAAVVTAAILAWGGRGS